LNYLVTIILLAGVIALPLLFQDELKRALTGLGQLRRRQGYGSSFDRFKGTILKTVRGLVSRNEGALIVLEGQTPLEDIIKTGIPLQAEVVTPELLQTIFHYKTPLHDGAVVFRGDRLVAASCILPVETQSPGARRLGTRHRSALGLSIKVPDALVIVVSEETGKVSIAWSGRIFSDVSEKRLANWLDRFQDQLAGDGLMRWSWLRGGGLRSIFFNLIVAVGLAVVAWVSVAYRTNPPRSVLIEGVPLLVTGPDEDLIVMSEVPETVDVQIRTTEDRVDFVDASSARATLHLEGFTEDVHQVEVDVTLADRFSQEVAVRPAAVNVALEPELNLVITPTVMTLDLEALPPGFTVGDVELSPETISLQGAESLVEMVAEARIEILIEDHRTDFQQKFSPLILDEDGEVVEGVTTTPREVLAAVPIRRTFFTREIGIQADLDLDTLEDGYQVTSSTLTPPEVTLAGTRSALDNAGEFLLTAPISLTGIHTEYTVDTPLIVPQGASALNDEGIIINTVTVRVEITPVSDFLVLDRTVNLRNLSPTLNGRVVPNRVSVLLVGPRPLLEEIDADPDLVVVYLDLEGFTSGTYDLELEVEAPPGVNSQLFPSEVQATIVAEGET
jgi:diadenylate cyclase